MARRRSSRRRRRGGSGFLYKLLSVLLICMAIILALTLFFRVDTIEVNGELRYTEDEIREAAGVKPGDNLYLLNKNDVAARIVEALPYIENVHPYRRLPDTLIIDVTECGRPLAVSQEDGVWLVSPHGKVVGRAESGDAVDYGAITGCTLLAPSVGTPIALATEYSAQQTSLIGLLTALESMELLDEVDAVHLDDLGFLSMDYGGRFTVRMAYGANYDWELQKLTKALSKDAIQSNMTGTFDLLSDSENVYFIPNVR